MTSSATADAVRAAATFGPYFALEVDAAEDPAWRPATELTDPAVLRDNVHAVRAVLAERARVELPELDLRACASTHFLGLASRFVAPSLAVFWLSGSAPRLALAALRWQHSTAGPVPVAITTPPRPAADFTTGVVDPVVRPVLAAFADTFGLSQHVLWGNVASAVAGAATMLDRAGPRPAPVEGAAARSAAKDLATRLMAEGPLAAMGEWTIDGFARNNCCLFYKIPGGGKCGDCVLLRRAPLG